jgi:hypothetical protein
VCTAPGIAFERISCAPTVAIDDDSEAKKHKDITDNDLTLAPYVFKYLYVMIAHIVNASATDDFINNSPFDL